MFSDVQFAKKLSDHVPTIGEEKEFVDDQTLRTILTAVKLLLETKPELVCELEKCKTVKKIIDIKDGWTDFYVKLKLSFWKK